MRSVSWRSRVAAVALVLVLLVPSAAASDTSTTDSGLWDEFLAWLRIDIPNGAADEDSFIAWLMIRIDIPPG